MRNFQNCFPIVVVALLMMCSLARATDEGGVFQKERLDQLGQLGLGIAFGLEGVGDIVSKKILTNRFEPTSTDEQSSYRFRGVTTTWLRPGPKPKEVFLQTLEVQGNVHPVSQRFGIGSMTAKHILDEYGKPAERAPNSLTYFVPDNVQDIEVVFFLAKGKLERIRWKFRD